MSANDIVVAVYDHHPETVGRTEAEAAGARKLPRTLLSCTPIRCNMPRNTNESLLSRQDCP